jgi:cytochrome c556
MAQPHDHAAHMAGMQAAQTNAAADTRQAVAFPAPMKEHTLTNMRDHLLALAQIQEALGRGAFDAAGQIAEQRLGMSSLQSHGAHEVAGFMPEGMQAAGQAMHRSASRFAVEAQNSSASGDVKPALAALASLTQACVACHASYRLK